MRLVSEKTRAAGVAARWKEAFSRGEEWSRCHIGDGDSRAIHEALVALGPVPRPDAVRAVLGGASWGIEVCCSQCGFSPDAVVGFDVEIYNDYFLCGECLAGALELLGGC